MSIATTRRAFLGAGAAFGAFNLAPSSVFGANAPSNRIVMGMIGVGGMGTGNMGAFLGMDDVQVVAVCDVNKVKTERAKAKVDKRNGNGDCREYRDFRELCARDDIDAVMIATPDHWHAYVGTFAASHGKDIYGEKPFTHDLLEGRALVRAVERSGRIWQTGSWQRSKGEFIHAVELVRNGHLGKIARVEVGLPGKHGVHSRSRPGAKKPDGLDWNFWLGPAPWREFTGVYDWDWRWVADWGGGQLMDWVGHHGDIAQWGLGTDLTGPVSFKGEGFYDNDPYFDTPVRYRVDCEYANGVKMVVGDPTNVRGGTTWYGENGEWVWVNRGRWDASTPALKNARIEAGELRFRSPGHQREFIDSVKSRKTTLTPAEVAHRSASVGHLCQIAIKTRRKIRWNPETETIVDDAEASRLLGRAPRGPWAMA